MSRKMTILWAVIVAIALAGAYWFGAHQGYGRGYRQAQVDVKTLQDEAAQKAANEAAKNANPFQAANPLRGVNTNPFEKAKNILNPFK